jgi:hypothetical protein
MYLVRISTRLPVKPGLSLPTRCLRHFNDRGIYTETHFDAGLVTHFKCDYTNIDTRDGDSMKWVAVQNLAHYSDHETIALGAVLLDPLVLQISTIHYTAKFKNKPYAGTFACTNTDDDSGSATSCQRDRTRWI